MKRIVSFILALALAAALVGCAPGAAPSAIAGPSVTDGAGAVLPIPENREEATIASVYAVSVPFITALGLTDRVRAINVKSKFWTDNLPALAAAGSVGRGVVDLEALATLSPDVFIHRANDPKTVEAVSKLGIAVLCISAEDFDGVKVTLRLLGEYFGAAERAEEVCRWMDTKFAQIDAIAAGIPESERVSALVMGGELGRVAGGDMLQSWMIEKAGGVCVSEAVEADRSWANVGVETIFDWNPDYLFCTGSTGLEYSVEGLYADAAWSALSAVENGRVYRIPASYDPWDMPGISCVVGTFYLLWRMYPDYFTAEALQKEIDDYYTFMFKKTFDPAYLGYDLEIAG
jgi:ABC-type Fe3+-hydroxamate transport system substrate-binding protein